jgi:RNA polymerase sigma-70 factor (ECF subfamily)
VLGTGRNVEVRTMTERELLHAACDGDADAFRRLVEPHHAMLHARCYRMLGSLHDGEDAFQDALLRAWRGLCGFNGRSGFRWWLYQIATNACLDAIARRAKRVRVFDDVDLAEELDPNGVVGLEEAYTTPEARYEEREAVELAFVAALQYLTPKQRGALVLRDVLSFSAKEAAESLGTTVPSVNSALQRARKAVEERLPEASEQSTLGSLGDERASAAVPRFVEAFEGGDVRAIVALLAEDATFATLPYAARDRAKIADVSALRVPEVLKRFRLPSELAA